MKKIILLLGWVWIFGLIEVHAQQHDIDDQVAFEAFADGVIDGQMKALDVPGVTISIVKDGRIILAKGYGLADVEKNIPVSAEKSIFNIASVSKTFIYTAAMQLFEQGKLDFDVDINHYLKDFKVPDTFKEPITVRHLLSHTAGFEDGFIGFLVKQEPTTLSLRQAVEQYRMRRVNPVGEYSVYSNYGVNLLAVVIEDIAGEDYQSYIEKNIYIPLGMEYSTFREPAPVSLQPYFSKGYKREGGVLVAQKREYTNFGPSSGMVSSGGDIAKYMLMHLGWGQFEGKQVLRPETAKLMQSRLFSNHDQFPAMAYGFIEQDYNGYRTFGHGGSSVYFQTAMVLDRANNMGIFISTNKVEGGDLLGYFIQSLYDRFFPQETVALKASTGDVEHLSRYEGNYFSWRSSFSLFEKLLMLGSGQKVNATEDGHLFMFGKKFVEIGKDMFQQVDGARKIFFRENEQGEIADFYIDNAAPMSFTRAPFYMTSGFSALFVAISSMLFLTAILARLFRYHVYRSWPVLERRALNSSILTAITHLLFLCFFAAVILANQDSIIFDLPDSIGVILTIAMVAMLGTLFQVYQTVLVWRNNYWHLWSRLYYSSLTLSACFLVWFYYYWNLLGYNYFPL